MIVRGKNARLLALMLLLAFEMSCYGADISKDVYSYVENFDDAVWHEHVVEKGETLLKIAIVYGGVRGVTMEDIIRANALKDSENLRENQLLLIPSTPENVEATRDEVVWRKLIVATMNERAQTPEVREGSEDIEENDDKN